MRIVEYKMGKCLTPCVITLVVIADLFYKVVEIDYLY